MDFPVYVTSDLTSSERRVSPQWKIGYLIQRLEQITGISAKYQTLQYYPTKTSNEYIIIKDSQLANADQDDKTISELNIVAYSRIHVLDTDPELTLLQLDQEDHEGYKMQDDEYAKRADSVLQWKKKEKLGRFDPNFVSQQEAFAKENELLAESIQVGSRCRVINIEGERRGAVRFVGKIQQLDESENVWVGIEFDEPVGKNDGLIGDLRIFQARPKHGSFVKPKQVEVGDFPELDPFGSDEEEL